MNKIKTKKIAAKRFKLTRNGKLVHRVQGARHIRRRKDKGQQRKQDRQKTLKTNMAKHVKAYLANA